MEIEFLASLDHNVGISDEAYLSWLDVLGTLAMSAAHARHSVYQPIAPSDYPFTFESTYPAPSYEFPPSTQYRARSTSPRSRHRIIRNGSSDMPSLQQGVKAIEIEPTTSSSSSPLVMPLAKKRSAAQVCSATPDRAVRRMKSTQDAQRRHSAQRLFARTQRRGANFDNQIYPANGSLEDVPPPFMASYQINPPYSMTHTNYSMPDDLATSALPSRHQGPAETAYLQLPYDYRLGYQPRQEVS
jgi:hypothetical protein